MNGLTPKQAECLDCIRDFIERTGLPPSIAEVSVTMGMHRRGAHRLFVGLRERGAITYTPGRQHSVALLGGVEAADLVGMGTDALKTTLQQIAAILVRRDGGDSSRTCKDLLDIHDRLAGKGRAAA